MISTMEHENKDFQKHTILKCTVKVPYGDKLLEPGTLAQILKKYGFRAYECKGENELMTINYEYLVDKSSEGSCIVQIHNTYWGARKTVILTVEKIVVTGPNYQRKVVCNTDLTSESSSEGESSEEENETSLEGKLLKIFNFVTYLKCLTTLH